MNSRIILGIVASCIIIGGLVAITLRIYPHPQGPQACTMEAKICPDGSSVGRGGPLCEFAACPTVTATPAPQTENDITLSIGEQGALAGLNITLNAFVQDSRCPIDVVCIQAGAVSVNVTLAHGSKSETRNMSSNEVPYIFDGYQVSIVNVAPPKESQKEIPSSSYRITFHVVPPKLSGTPSAALGTLTGKVTLSPTCPVERNPPDPNCAPKPYAATLDINGAHNFFIELHAGSDGIFRTDLAPGSYTIMTRQTSLYPRCESTTVTITGHMISTVNISCDSGIR